MRLWPGPWREPCDKGADSQFSTQHTVTQTKGEAAQTHKISPFPQTHTDNNKTFPQISKLTHSKDLLADWASGWLPHTAGPSGGMAMAHGGYACPLPGGGPRLTAVHHQQRDHKIRA